MITADDIKKLARLSAFDVTDQEVEELLVHLSSVLTYASRVEQLADIIQDVSLPAICNVMRQDTHYISNSQAIIDQFPHSAQNFIVVPRIIGQ